MRYNDPPNPPTDEELDGDHPPTTIWVYTPHGDRLMVDIVRGRLIAQQLDLSLTEARQLAKAILKALETLGVPT